MTTKTVTNFDGHGNVVSTSTVDVPPSAENLDAIHTAARQALGANRTFIASTPTAAQSTAQVKALSRQVNGIIRLLLNELEGTD